MATAQPDRLGAWLRTSEKNAVQQAFTECRFVASLGNSRGTIGLFGWRQSRLPPVAVYAEPRAQGQPFRDLIRV